MRYFIGNWKMFGVPKSVNILNKINSFYSKDKNRNKYRVIITPPYTLIESYAKYFKNKKISIGSQNCYQKEQFSSNTAAISPYMLRSVGAQYTNAVTSTWNGSNYFSPITFVHDYTLDNFHGTGASTYANACKIRVGITFYPVLVDTLTESKQVHYWQAVIQLIDVINVGAGYTKAVEFVLSWPPERDPIHENASNTPYFPDPVSYTHLTLPTNREV